MEVVLKPFPLFLKACVFSSEEALTRWQGFWVRDGVSVLRALRLLTRLLLLLSSFLSATKIRLRGSAESQPGRGPPGTLRFYTPLLPSHHAPSDTQPCLPFSLPKATKRGGSVCTPYRGRDSKEHALPLPVQEHVSLLCT